LRLKDSSTTNGNHSREDKTLRLFLFSRNNNELCIRRIKRMSTQKMKKGKSIDELTAQERQAIYNSSPYFKKKHEEAVEFLKKHPIPKEYLKR
jgi:hypothetical protein